MTLGKTIPALGMTGEYPRNVWGFRPYLLKDLRPCRKIHLVDTEAPRSGRREARRGASSERRIEILDSGADGPTPTDQARTFGGGRIGRDAVDGTGTQAGRSHEEGAGRVARASHHGDLAGCQAHAAECVAGPEGTRRGEGSSGSDREPRRRVGGTDRSVGTAGCREVDSGRLDRETFPGRQVRASPRTRAGSRGSAAVGREEPGGPVDSEPRGVESAARRARLLGASLRFRRRCGGSPVAEIAGGRGQSSLSATAFGVTFIFGSYSTWMSLASAPWVARSCTRQASHGP